jgi:hypothetical protein
MRPHVLRAVLLAATAALLTARPREAHAGLTYLALGDSLAFGVGADDSTMDVSNGDRGYVGAYASILGAIGGGRPPERD